MSARLALVTGALVVLLTAALTLIAGTYATQRVWNDQAQLLAATSARIANQVDQALSERWQDITKVAALRLFRATTGSDALQRRQLDRLADAFPEYAWIGYTDAKGQVLIASDGLLEGADVSQRPWWRSATQRPFIGDIHAALLLEALLQPDSGEPLRFVDIAAPVMDENGQLIGVVGAHLYTQWVRELVATVIATAEDMRGAQVLIINDNNQVIVGPPDLDLDANAPQSAAAAQTARIGHLRESWLDGQPGVTGFATANGFRDFPGLGWRVLVHRPEHHVLAPVRRLQLRMALAALVVASVFAGLALVLLRNVTRPLRELEDALQRAAHVSDLESLDVPGAFRELHQVVKQLRALALRIRNSEQQLDQERQVGRQQATQIQALRETVATDPLTGVLNRRGLEDRLRRLQDSLDRFPRPVSVIALDLDHFKAINDSHGHAAGDAVLKAMAAHIQGLLRTTDVFARLGGEEFLAVLPEADATQAQQLAERLRASIEACVVDHGGSGVRVTASFGVVSASADQARDLQQLIRNADALTYRAKQAGRNCVMSEDT